MKRVLLISICLILCFSQNAFAAPTVSLNGVPIEFTVPPTIENGRTLVPLRAIFEAIGASVQWDGGTKTITANKESTEIKLIIGGLAYKNSQGIELDTPAKIIEGRTMVPLRFVAESLDCSVAWDGVTQNIAISSNAPINQITPPIAVTPKAPANQITPPSGSYNDYQKVQYYLTKLGFNTEEKNKSEDTDNRGILTKSSIILFQDKMELRITGLADEVTLASLVQCANNGLTYDDIMNKSGKQLQRLSESPEINGRLDKNILTVIPEANGATGLLPEYTAVGWAKLVQTAAIDPNNDMSIFLLRTTVGGYRSYDEQVKLFHKNGPTTAGVPGTSPHGWGLAVDFNTKDPRTGRAQSDEVKWLEKNAASFHFYPTNHAIDGSAWEPYFQDGGINFYETWHWNY